MWLKFAGATEPPKHTKSAEFTESAEPRSNPDSGGLNFSCKICTAIIQSRKFSPGRIYPSFGLFKKKSKKIPYGSLQKV